MKYIEDMMVKFEAKHLEHMKIYGDNNYKRMTGKNDTSSMTKFSYGVGDRLTSFRIPT
jgi:glutamine synthetase